MVGITGKYGLKQIVIALTFTILVAVAGVVPASSHGGREHGGAAFTSLQAVQKALELYDRLITQGRLPEQWEAGLDAIHVGTRHIKGKDEFMVQFKRAEGDNGSVYFFFSRKGEYSGSNFTGE